MPTRIAAIPGTSLRRTRTPARVLVVDDALLNRKLMESILRSERCELQLAEDGRQALAFASAEPPDLVLLDVTMPGLDGRAVAAELGRCEATAHVPVILMAAPGEAADKMGDIERGAVDWLTKPLNRGEVLARVRAQLRIVELTRSAARARRLRRRRLRRPRD